MQEQTGAHRAARLFLRALFLAGAALVVVLIGSSTAQADDADAAPGAPAAPAKQSAAEQATPAARPAHRLGSVVDRASHVMAAAHRSTQQASESTTRTVREVGRRAPVVEPATETVATVVDRAAGRLDTRVTEVTKAAQALVDRTVTDVADGVLAPEGSAPEADVESAPAEDSTAPPSASDRRTDRAHGVHAAPATAAAATSVQDAAPAAQAVRLDRSHNLPPLDAILELGAFSGAPSAGSGAAGGPSSAGTLPAAFTAPADVSLGVVIDADDERVFALPLTPGWSPD